MITLLELVMALMLIQKCDTQQDILIPSDRRANFSLSVDSLIVQRGAGEQQEQESRSMRSADASLNQAD